MFKFFLTIILILISFQLFVIIGQNQDIIERSLGYEFCNEGIC